MAGASSANACVFLKNPVYQKGSPLSASLSSTSDLSSLQKYGVRLTGMDASGYLQNSTFTVAPPGLTRATADANGNWKFPFSTCSAGSCTVDPDHRLGQVMAYYWLSTQEQVMITRTGHFYSSGQGVVVETYKTNYNNAAYNFVENKIQMGATAAGNEYALSAEVYNHEMGHANFHHANADANAGYASSTHAYCGPTNASPRPICCKTNAGCIGGIHEGQADYHAAIIFDQPVALGETIYNNLNGFTECGISRTIAQNMTLLAQTAFDACNTGSYATYLKPGEFHLMGRIYAAIWWGVRSKAGNNAQEVDRLFTEHLAVLNISDTVATAITRIQTLDVTLFGGKYSADFAAELAKH